MFLRKLRYRFDNLMSKGAFVLILMLVIVSLLIVFIAGAITVIIDGTKDSFASSVWENFIYTLDVSYLSMADMDTAVIYVASAVTLLGLFTTSILVGIITSGIETKLDDLKRGRSVVCEKGHTVILGFNELSMIIMKELNDSTDNKNRMTVAVLDDREKFDMEEEIRAGTQKSKNMKFICRSGSISDIESLKICSIETCRSVIIAGEDDYSTLKAVLAVTKLLNESNCDDVNITTVVHDQKNTAAISIAGGERIEVIDLQHTIARITAHSCLQPGVSNVYTELFDFAGDEIYVEKIKGADGMNFLEASLCFPKSVLLGIIRDGEHLINPSYNTILKESDDLVLISENGRSEFCKKDYEMSSEKVLVGDRKRKETKNLLIFGYNPMLYEILEEIDKYISKGSKIQIVINRDYSDSINKIEKVKMANASVTINYGELNSCECLERLLSEKVNDVLILSYNFLSKDEADIESMRLLLLLRDIAKQRNLSFGITTEIANAENQHLISSEASTDFIVGDYLTALIMSQVSKTRVLAGIFDELLDEEGSEIYIKPAVRYVVPEMKTDIFTAVLSASRRKEIFLGYRKKKNDGTNETVINPLKTNVEIFTENDDFIVLAEN